jgi:hypothetical protein
MYVVSVNQRAYMALLKHTTRVMYVRTPRFPFKLDFGPLNLPGYNVSSKTEYMEEVYSDYLYDCYICNQRLTEEDWLYYGKEEHHIEIPRRDGGLLTPCNSQYLTTYQHWVAGLMQSECLQKCCYAMVPKNVLPCRLEELRVKWHFLKEQTKREIPTTESWWIDID